jgi:hypothetical protein
MGQQVEGALGKAACDCAATAVLSVIDAWQQSDSVCIVG